MPQIVIRRDREKPVLQQHPWIFSGAIQEVRGNPAPGDIVDVVSTKGHFLARGYWNPKSQIQVRILTWQDESINDDWWRRMIQQSILGRQHIATIQPLGASSYRAINAENDFLPGLIADVYGRWIVIQALTLGIDQRKEMLANLIRESVEEFHKKFADQLEPPPFDHIAGAVKGVYERSDVDVRGKEGLKPSTGVLWGEAPPELIKVFEGKRRAHLVDIRNGHKTGFYIDQHRNRVILSSMLRNEYGYSHDDQQHRILNLFSYTGGFGLSALYALHGAAYVINVDSSHEALEIAKQSYGLNYKEKTHWGIPNPDDYAKFIQADVFQLLRDYVDQGEKFDFIVCDPPKFAHNAGQVDKAARGYKDLNLHCFKLLNPGGYLMTFSCSGAISADLFQKIVFGALVDSGRQGQIVQYLSAAPDHPVALTFPEGAYLKGLVVRVI